MPPRKRQQTTAMLYTLIVFVGLFIAATTTAVIYYVETEKHKTNAADLQRQIDEFASTRERQTIGTLVGAKPSRETWLGTMVNYLDGTVSLIMGGVLEPTSAEVKVKEANGKVQNALQQVREYIDIGDPNKVGLLQIIQELQAELGRAEKARVATQQQLDDKEEEFRRANEANFEKEQVLLAEKGKLQQQVDKIKQDYAKLQALLKQSTEEQVKTLTAELEEEKANSEELNDRLLKTEAELKRAEDMMKRAQEEIMKIMPPPDREVSAYKPDGRIILIGDQAKVVHLDIGSNDHVYRGLTFTVYNKGTSISRDGKGKAEIEVFDVAKTFSVARVTPSETGEPILLGDIVANLIWDSDKTNVFVVAGDFDLDGDGDIDYDAFGKIKALVEKWGGRAVDTVSVDTDFLVLGSQPQVPKRPTLEERELAPEAMERYEAAQQRVNHYKEVQSQAQALWLPVFTYERFLYFIGYKGHIGRAGAF